MKTIKTLVQNGAILFLMAFSPGISHAQIYLTGLLNQGADPNTGASDDSPIFTSESGVAGDYAVTYLTQPNAGYDAPFLNPGASPNTRISYDLTPGNYQFYFWTVSFFGNAPGYPNNPGTYGLNLFFGNDSINPGIAAFSQANVASATPVQAGASTLPLDGDGTREVPASGNLVYVSNGLKVTLTSFGYGEPGVFGGPALDRVNSLNSVPDGYASAVGEFGLSVAVVPESKYGTLMTIFSILALCIASFRFEKVK